MAQNEPRELPVGRLRGAWYVLMGQRVTPLQMRAEWLEYKLIFEDILTRFGAQLSRSTKAEKKRAERELDSREPPEMQRTGKAAVRARVAAQQGLTLRGRTHQHNATMGNGAEE